jgi:hypothetical protein
MALWRAEALQRLPELRQIIDSAHEIMALWINLHLEFVRACEKVPHDESLISRIYSFADWCTHAKRGTDAGRDPLTAVNIAFFEDIPLCKPACEDMPRWVTFDEVAEAKEIFSYHIGEEQYRALLQYMSQNRDKYLPRNRTITNSR